MIPVIPLLMALLMIALWHHYDAGGFLFRKKKLLCSIVGLSLVINLLLLGTFTVNYSHRGLVEPFVRVEKLDPRPRVVLVSPERFQIYPFYYGGYDYIRHFIVNDWSDLDSFVPDAARPNFFFLYPASPEDLPSYVDSITRRFGGLTEVFHVAPSVVDLALHRLNPGYNPTHEAWAYRLERESPL